MTRKIVFSILILTFVLYYKTSFVFAEIDELPEPLVGQAEVTQSVGENDIKYYGATSGNETVYNDSTSGEPLGFMWDNEYNNEPNRGLINCVNGIFLLKSSESCFHEDPSTSLFEIMTGKTYYNGAPGVEVAALFYYPDTYISGDANLGGMNQIDFNYFGRHLTYGTTGVADKEEGWSLSGGNIVNPNAQATLSGEEYDKYIAKISIIKNEAKELYSIDSGSWFMQGAGLDSIVTNPSENEIDKYPEGKVWYYKGDLSLNNIINYTGKGTIIVEGKLIINNGTKINKSNLGDNRLGFIVLGEDSNKVSVSVGSECNINASIFSFSNIIMNGSNTEMRGSFVAKEFKGLAETGIINLHFYYDYDLDTAWPPGFRYLNMPKPAR